jgi:hypothetical protein
VISRQKYLSPQKKSRVFSKFLKFCHKKDGGEKGVVGMICFGKVKEKE